MTRKHPFSAVDRSLARRYLDAARRFKTDAENMMDAADGFSGNGIAVLCVHAAIAHGDAIAILAADRKSKSGDHRDAAPFLASVVPIRTTEDKAALRAFQAILNRKDEISYTGNVFDREEVASLSGKLVTFARWAEQTFESLRQRAS